MYFGAVHIVPGDSLRSLRTRLPLIQHQLGFRTGELYNPEQLQQTRASLMRTDLFRGVTLDTLPVAPEDSLQPVEISLLEKRYLHLESSAFLNIAGSRVEPGLSANLQHRNWLGRGTRLGLDAGLGAGEGDGVAALVLDGDGEKRDADLLARRQKHVHLALVGLIADALGERGELIGHVPRRRDDHHDVIALLAGRDGPLGGPVDPCRVGDRGAAEFHDHYFHFGYIQFRVIKWSVLSGQVVSPQWSSDQVVSVSIKLFPFEGRGCRNSESKSGFGRRPA